MVIPFQQVAPQGFLCPLGATPRRAARNLNLSP